MHVKKDFKDFRVSKSAFFYFGCLGSFLFLESLDFEILDRRTCRKTRRLRNFYPLINPLVLAYFAEKLEFENFDTLEPKSLLGISKYRAWRMRDRSCIQEFIS